MYVMDAVAAMLGCTPAALRLLVGVLLGYPLAIVFRRSVAEKSNSFQHVYFVITGLALVIFNYGWDTLHSLTNIFVVYAVMRFAGRTKAGMAFNFIFTMGYLLLGYLFTATENYDIKWTMPHCILCLRLIGVAFDYYDGADEDQQVLPTDRRITALNKMPTLLEMLGHSYFFGGCMVGPQFPMKRYKDFVEGNLYPEQRIRNPDSITYAIGRFMLGIALMAVYQVGAMHVNERVIITDDFLNWPWFSKWLFLGMFCMISLHKYVACWLLAEGSCALTGLSFNGYDNHGNNKWDGLQNLWVWKFETTTNFDGLIRSFNINTNKWVAQYVFKRLRFLGNKDLSQIIALFFLALWHGFHLGYYVCFVHEFLIMKFERDATLIIDTFPSVRNVIYHDKLHWLRLIFMKIYVVTLFGYSLAPFSLLRADKIHKLYASFYYFPNILLVSWFVASFRLMPIVMRLHKINNRQRTDSELDNKYKST